MRRLWFSLLFAWAALVGAALLLVAAFSADAASRFADVRYDQPITVHRDGSLRQGSLLVGRFLPGPDGATASIALPVTVDEEPLSADFTLALPASLPAGDLALQPVSIQGNIQVFSAPAAGDPTRLAVTLPGLLADAHTKLRLTAPASDLSFSPGIRLLVWLESWSPLAWSIAIGLLLLFGGLSFIIALPNQRRGTLNQALVKGLTPVEAAIFTHSSLHPRDLAALIFDLGQRGYLQFIDRPSQGEVLVFRSRTGEGALRTYEEWMLNILAPRTDQPQSVRQALANLDRGVFSQGVGALYVEAYRLFTQQGYVAANPRILHLRWKTLGIITQLLGVVTALLAYLTGSALTYLPLAGVAAYVAGFLIYQAAARLLPLTPAGEQAFGSLNALRTYLSQRQPVTTTESREGALLYRLMPYALALGVERQWGNRFATTRCIIPP